MQSVSRISTMNQAALRTGEWVAEIPSIGLCNEHECPYCRDIGWRWIDLPGSAGMKQCDCLVDKARARYLAVIPERFKNSSFESFKPRHAGQQRALSLLQKDPGGSWYLAGAYGNGKTHLLYAQ
jgi:DNA replication protein DnaC